MDFGKLMRETGELLEIGNLEPDANGVCAIVAPHLTVSVEGDEAQARILMSAEICRIPEARAQDAELLRALVAANFQYRETRGATVAVDPKGDGVWLFIQNRNRCWTPTDVVHLLGRFLDAAQRIRALSDQT